MPNNWKTYKLGEIAGFSYGKMPKKELLAKGIYPTYSGYKYQYKYPEFNCDKNDIIIVARGVGGTGDVKIVKEKCYLTNLSIKIELDKNIVDFQYFYFQYFLNTLRYLDSGSAQSQITINDLNRLELKLPPLQEQQSISSILSAIDDKIENNLAINKTLEEMAMALYTHWFVDFGPFQDGEFVESELGMIPKGWEVKRIKDFVTLVMGQSPKSEFYNTIKEGNPFHQGVTNYGDRFPEDKTYSTDGNRFAEEGDVLFSVRAPVGRLNIAKNKIILGRGIASMRLKEFKENNFLFYLLKNTFTKDDIIGDGTVYGSVNKIEIENLKFVVPNKSTLNSFNEIILDIDNKYSNNYKENQTLTQVRDTLLPQLISGAVRLKEFRE